MEEKGRILIKGLASKRQSTDPVIFCQYLSVSVGFEPANDHHDEAHSPIERMHGLEVAFRLLPKTPVSYTEHIRWKNDSDGLLRAVLPAGSAVPAFFRVFQVGRQGFFRIGS